RDHVTGRANLIGWEPGQLAHVLIGDVVKSHRIKDLLLEGEIRGAVERDRIGFLSLCKRLRSLLGRLKFYLQGDSGLHLGNVYNINHSIAREDRATRNAPRDADFLRPDRIRQSPSAKLMSLSIPDGISFSKIRIPSSYSAARSPSSVTFCVMRASAYHTRETPAV